MGEWRPGACGRHTGGVDTWANGVGLLHSLAWQGVWVLDNSPGALGALLPRRCHANKNAHGKLGPLEGTVARACCLRVLITVPYFTLKGIEVCINLWSPTDGTCSHWYVVGTFARVVPLSSSQYTRGISSIRSQHLRGAVLYGYGHMVRKWPSHSFIHSFVHAFIHSRSMSEGLLHAVPGQVCG